MVDNSTSRYWSLYQTSLIWGNNKQVKVSLIDLITWHVCVYVYIYVTEKYFIIIIRLLLGLFYDSLVSSISMTKAPASCF